jgi:hypothetical protein
LLKEPFALEGFAGDPIKQESIYLRAHDLHEIAGKAIASGCVNVKHADTGVKAQSRSGQPGFGFENGIEIIKDSVRRVHCKTGRPG